MTAKRYLSNAAATHYTDIQCGQHILLISHEGQFLLRLLLVETWPTKLLLVSLALNTMAKICNANCSQLICSSGIVVTSNVSESMHFPCLAKRKLAAS